MSKQIGTDQRARITFRVDESVKEQYQQEVGNMTDDLTDYVKSVVEDGSNEVEYLPDDELLADAYRCLNKHAAPDTHRIEMDVAKSLLADQLNRPKSTLMRSVIRPLERRGYIEPKWGVLRVCPPESED